MLNFVINVQYVVISRMSYKIDANSLLLASILCVLACKVISVCCCVLLLAACQPGRYLLDGVCYSECPLSYFPANVTSSSVTDTGLPVAIVGICSRCNSVAVCADLLRLLLAVVGIVTSVAILIALVVFACVRGVCRRPSTKTSIDSFAAAHLHSPRYITNGHIISGLSTKPLLAESDSDSLEDECEMQSNSASVNNI